MRILHERQHRAPARARRAGLRRHRLRRDDAAPCAGVASAAGRHDISVQDTRELRQHRANCLRFEACGLGRGVTTGDALPWTVVHRWVVGGTEAAIHQCIAQTVGIRDCDAPESRCVLEPVWRPSPAAGTNQQAAGRSPRERGRRRWR